MISMKETVTSGSPFISSPSITCTSSMFHFDVTCLSPIVDTGGLFCLMVRKTARSNDEQEQVMSMPQTYVWVACSPNGYPTNAFGGYVVHEDQRVVEHMAHSVGGRTVRITARDAEHLTPRAFLSY